MPQEYVVSFPASLDARIFEASNKVNVALVEGNFQEAERLLKTLYQEMMDEENRLAEGQRYHKGWALHNWGIAILLQRKPQRIPEAYNKIILAYIEDLLDFDSIEQVRAAPAYKTLVGNPWIMPAYLNMIQDEVERRKAAHEIPKNPEDVLKPFSDETKRAVEKPLDITIDQIRSTVLAWLDDKDKGVKEKRVFVGGNYKNIAVLRHIADTVRDFDYIPVMPIDLPETSEQTHETLIHDISIEMLQNCPYAIFEVTISDGHLMEIERARDFKGLKVILVYQAIKQGEQPTITRMLITTNFEKKPYRNFSELTTEIRNFLPKK